MGFQPRPEPSCYVDRGDPAAYDWQVGDFTIDTAWHDLDLSSIVPPSAAGCPVAISCHLDHAGVEKFMLLREKGRVNDYNVITMLTQAAGVRIRYVPVVVCDSECKIEYKILNVAGWNNIDVLVRGWWQD